MVRGSALMQALWPLGLARPQQHPLEPAGASTPPLQQQNLSEYWRLSAVAADSAASTAATAAAAAAAASSECKVPGLAKDRAKALRFFCYAVVVPDSSEPDLLRFQLKKRAGIFSCDGFAIFSNVTSLGHGLPMVLDVINGPMTVNRASWLQHFFIGDALNTPLFMQAWRWFLHTGTHNDYDWTIKLDADTVFWAPVLRLVLADPLPVTIPPCKRANRTQPLVLTVSGDWLPGPIEALNTAAMRRIMRRLHNCSSDLPPNDWGEDLWLSKCRGLGDASTQPVASCVPLGDRLLQWEGVPVWETARCNLPDGPSAALHPYKTLNKQRNCLEKMMRVATRRYHVDELSVSEDYVPEGNGTAGGNEVSFSYGGSETRMLRRCGSVWCWRE